MKTVVNITKEVFCAADGIVIFAGISLYGRSFVDYLMTCVPKEVTKNWQIMGDHENIDELVDQSDIPFWWYSKDSEQGAPHDPNDKRNTWKWEQCLTEGSDITVREIFCPGPWLDGVGERKPLVSSRSEPLETFEEGDEEEEW